MPAEKKAIFIDKDGTLIPDVPYNVDPGLIRLQPGAAAGLKELQQQGYLLVVISNQSGVARGYFKEEALKGVEARIRALLEPEGVYLDGFYYCPHYPGAPVREYAVDCECRKPKAGMLLQAARDFGIDLSRSWMIGDILNDVEAGKKAGCRAVLIDNGNETEWQLDEWRQPDYQAADILDAARFILRMVKDAERKDEQLA